ncbi:hypothetical protein CD58_14825 [Pseudomonas brassicacearum]|uniref:hypothetical protein n=1 Tax=Pseudomonas brassicacearum TaxID=930166 RepID=UPI00042F4207|nr:hypothetical protein [Pseudomonas brassicacearum]AHL34109.1 hypothetical protein CD58_14825 [Pseudomonas brassicacearum]
MSPEPEHPPYWHYDKEPPPAENLVLVFVFTSLFIFAVWAIGALPGVLSETTGDFMANYLQSITETPYLAVLFVLILVSGVIIGLPIGQVPVMTFSFDESGQHLTFTQTRRNKEPVEVKVPFSDILWIAPFVTSFYGRCGHYRVGFRGPTDEPLRCCLGFEMPVEEMEFHATWLKGLIGERVQALDWGGD